MHPIDFAVWLLTLAFLPAVGQTGSPRFADRERASATLTAWWPLSEPATERGQVSPDAEVARRCARVSPDTWRSDLLAACVVAHRNERDGLPLADEKYFGTWKEVLPGAWRCGVAEWNTVARDVFPVPVRLDQIRQSMIRLAEVNGIDTSNTYYFGETQFWQHPTGWNYVRLRTRGLAVGGSESWRDVGLEAMRAEWAKIRPR